MPSRLLNRLNDEIGKAASTLEADCLRAQRAAYWVRLGAFEQAEVDMAALHARYDARPQAAISAWLNLAEGLKSHYTDLGPLARDKFQRAHALSGASGLTAIQALSAAWLAHLAYRRMDVRSLALHIGQALRLAAASDHAALSRASLVMAQCLDGAGRADLAKPWYERAHHHAVADGDDTTLGSLMWHLSAGQVAALRQPAGSADASAKEHKQARMSVDSTERFDVGVGVRSLQPLRPILRAQLLTEHGECIEALALFEAHLGHALEQGMATLAGTLFADQAWCRFHAGQHDAALADARQAEAQMSRGVRHGDRAPGHARLALLFAALGLDDAAAAQHQLAEQAWQAHAADQASLLDALAPLGAPAPLDLRTGSC